MRKVVCMHNICSSFVLFVCVFEFMITRMNHEPQPTGHPPLHLFISSFLFVRPVQSYFLQSLTNIHTNKQKLKRGNSAGWANQENNALNELSGSTLHPTPPPPDHFLLTPLPTRHICLSPLTLTELRQMVREGYTCAV